MAPVAGGLAASAVARSEVGETVNFYFAALWLNLGVEWLFYPSLRIKFGDDGANSNSFWELD